jgi:neutral trehalase
MLMANKQNRAEREMQALIRKMQKRVGKLHNIPEGNFHDEHTPRKKRYMEHTEEHDQLVKDASAEAIFREMKRRPHST